MKSRKRSITAESSIKTQKTSHVTQTAPGTDLHAALAPERREREFFNKNEYVLDWLAGDERKTFSPLPDMDKRFDTLLTILQKERKNVLQFKIKQNKP